MQVALADEAATDKFGRALSAVLARATQELVVLYLHGELGMGKTTLSRALLRGLGHQGSVKSPTYTLVEEYDLDRFKVYHFDLYRLADPEELEFMGIRDFLSGTAGSAKPTLCIVEWPEKGAGILPQPDIDIEMQFSGEGRIAVLTDARRISEIDLGDVKASMESGYA